MSDELHREGFRVEAEPEGVWSISVGDLSSICSWTSQGLLAEALERFSACWSGVPVRMDGVHAIV